MHKKLAADLTSIAHSILQLKNKEDVLVLKEKAYEVYEKLTVLAYVDEYLSTSPNATETKEELLEKVENAAVKTKEPVAEIVEELQEDEVTEVESITEKVEKIVKELTDETVEFSTEKENVLNVEEGIVEQPFDEIESLFSQEPSVKNDAKDIGDRKTPTLDEELSDTISIDVAADLFEKPTEKPTLNDKIAQNLQIGLNDRIAFVKHLFEGNQEDFNRVISQINTLKTLKEAKKFINKMVKPDYDWAEKEEYETRFTEIVERKFI